MLKLTRKPGDTVLIGDQIEIVVLEVSRSEVRIGIKAPRTTPILRGEIAHQVAQANRHAGRGRRDIGVLKEIARAGAKHEPSS